MSEVMHECVMHECVMHELVDVESEGVYIYYHNKFSINIHNYKGTWKLIKNIINKSNDNKNNYVCKNNDSSFSIAKNVMIYLVMWEIL